MVLKQQQRVRRLTRRPDAFVEENVNGFTLFHPWVLCFPHFSVFSLFSFTHSVVINVKRLHRNDVRHTSFTLAVPLILHFTYPPQIMRRNLSCLCFLARLALGRSGVHYQCQHRLVTLRTAPGPRRSVWLSDEDGPLDLMCKVGELSWTSYGPSFRKQLSA